MKTFLTSILLFAGAGLMQASILQTISFDLSNLHPGSTLSGTFTLPDGVTVGTTVPVTLLFSDPSNYIPSSLMGTVTISSGTTFPFAVFFFVPTFTNPSGNSFTTTNNLMAAGAAQCASFPCTSTGRFEDNNPPAFAALYTITPAAAVPEPGYGVLVPVLLAGLVLGKRFGSANENRTRIRRLLLFSTSYCKHERKICRIRRNLRPFVQNMYTSGTSRRDPCSTQAAYSRTGVAINAPAFMTVRSDQPAVTSSSIWDPPIVTGYAAYGVPSPSRPHEVAAAWDYLLGSLSSPV
jgi:hypothetical protein